MSMHAEGIWNQPSTTHISSARSMASTNNGSAADSGSASISANDFLTLLVTEMQNQDPTAQTDPNEYINQLVQVNSLEQLISINQTLTGDVSGNTADRPATDASTRVHGADPFPLLPTVPQGGAADAAHSATALEASGNLTIPPGNPAAMRVALALAKD